MQLFISCAPGLETILFNELTSFGYKPEEGFAGVYVKDVTYEDIYRINYSTRVGSRVLMPIHDCMCYDEKTLYKGMKKLPWHEFIPQGKTFAIDANVHHNKLRNSMHAALVLKDAICDSYRETKGFRPDVDRDKPDIKLNLFIDGTTAIVSYDTSGDPLHQRGYRLENSAAPLRETLAAAILLLAGYNGETTLLDPCAGSGTILIEAAMIATNTPPGSLRRRFGFMKLPFFKTEKWLEVKVALDEARKPLKSNMIFGLEYDLSTFQMAKRHLRAIGFPQVDIQPDDFRHYEPKVLPKMVVTNPPYGERIGNPEELKELYRSLGDFFKRKLDKPAKAWVLTTPELSKEIGLKASRKHPFSNGGIECRLSEIEVY